MSSTKMSRLRQIASRVKEAFGELNYTARRLWEVAAEMPGLERQQPRKREGSPRAGEA